MYEHEETIANDASEPVEERYSEGILPRREERH